MHAWSPPDAPATAAARSPRDAAPAEDFRRAVEAIAARHHLLDFADTRVGHPDYEWAGAIEFVFRGAPGCLRACLEAYGDAEPGPGRAAALCAWGPVHRFGDLGRAAAAVDAEPGDWDGLIARLYGLDDERRP